MAVRAAIAVAVLPLLIAAGCADGATGGVTTLGAGAGSSGTGEGGTDFGSSTSSGIDDACATATIEGEPIAVTMYIMFDKSGSMLQDQKWAGSKAALIAFFQDDESAGLNVALRFFPDDVPVAGCNESACDVAACATPLVEAGELNAQPAHSDPQQAALVDAVEARSPGGQTPTYAALAGAEQWATSHAATQPDGTTAVVLVTDGEPNGCVEDIGSIAGLAADAFSQGVLTYAIGISGASTGQLNQIAQAGGTDKAFMVGSGSVHTQLNDALKQIRRTRVACTLTLPDSQVDGEEIDPRKVNVNYNSGDDSETIPQVASAGLCDSSGGWYYDDPDEPTIVTLCPASCETVQADPDAQLSIVLGCETIAL